MNAKLKKIKYNIDKITSSNATSWQLVLFWIIVFEFLASIVEYIYIDKKHDLAVVFPHTLYTELFVAIAITLFVWFCIYNIIYENKGNILRLTFFAILGIYFIITNDFTLQFLFRNINPLHFFDYSFGLGFLVELFFKLVITYLLYQFIICLKNTK